MREDEEGKEGEEVQGGPKGQWMKGSRPAEWAGQTLPLVPPPDANPSRTSRCSKSTTLPYVVGAAAAAGNVAPGFRVPSRHPAAALRLVAVAAVAAAAVAAAASTAVAAARRGRQMGGAAEVHLSPRERKSRLPAETL